MSMPKPHITSVNTPTIITIFGATGDLAYKKLLPALINLDINGLLPDRCIIVGFSRKAYSDEDYQSFVQTAIEDHDAEYSDDAIAQFCQRVRYVQGEFDNMDDYRSLEAYLRKFEDEWGQCINKLLYLAVPPRFYETIFEHIGETDLPNECSGATGFSRLIVEKPFGSDLETAQKLDETLSNVFREEQIFRIDHYLGKDAVQNLLTFRFTNILFENSWNAENIESVHIRMFEKIGVRDRGDFYDTVGALRDVGQNHLLQILALTAMESPGVLKADALREKREELLRSVRTYEDPSDIEQFTVRGQYVGYRDIDGVANDSETETYFKLKAFVDNDRWRDVPFILEAGKKLGEKNIDITVTFKAQSPCVCGEAEDDKEHDHKNILTIQLQPEHRVSMRFWAKKPGIAFALTEKSLGFSFEKSELRKTVPDAYEKLLFDCIQGDQTLFVSTKEVEEAWRFITPIATAWNTTHKPDLVLYNEGTVPDVHI